MLLNIRSLSNSRLLRSSAIYTATGFVNAAIPLLLLPILTKELSANDYGIITMFQLVVSILYPLVSMNFEGAVARKYYDGCSKEELPVYIGNVIIAVVVNSLIYLFIFWIVAGDVGRLTKIGSEWLIMAFVVVLAQFVSSLTLTIYQVRILPLRYGLFQIVQSVSNISFTLWLVIYLKQSWTGRILSQVYSGVVFMAIGLLILVSSKLIILQFNKSHLLNAVKFGMPLIPHALGGFLFTAIDRIFLTNMSGLDQTGNYAVAYQLGAIINLITLAFNNAYTPWLYQSLNKNDFPLKVKIVKFTYLYFVILIIIACSVYLLFPFITNLFVAKHFASVDSFSIYIIGGFVFQGMYYMVTNYIGYAKKTYFLAAATFIVAIIKIPITYLLIKNLGPSGAAISYCITFMMFFFLTWFLSNLVYKMPWFNFVSNA